MAKSHGHRGGNGGESRTYCSWKMMIQRCTNRWHESYKYYGGAGVKVCERWRSFALFLADMGERPPDMSLDRIDPFEDYEPSNCRWADKWTQASNKRKKS